MQKPVQSAAPQPRAPHPHSLDAIAARLHCLRRSVAMNQTEFARAAGLGIQAYNQYERAHGRPRLDAAMQIRARFGVTLDWLYLGDTAGLPLARIAELTAVPD